MFRIRTARLLALACLSIWCGQESVTESKAEGSVKRAAIDLKCDTTTTPPADSNFPKGFDYPQQVQSWVQPGNGDRMRLHAWCLFAGLNQAAKPNGPLLWQSWKTSTQAFPYQYNPWKSVAGAALPNRPSPLNSRNFANAKSGGANPINNKAPVYPINAAVANKYPTCTESMAIPDHPDWKQLKDGVHMQSNGDIMVAGVIYNDAAINHILGNNGTRAIVGTRLYNAVTLNNLLPKDKNDPPKAIPWFPASSIVLKPMFWPVKKGGFTALPVWDWDANKPGSPADGKYAGYEIQPLWTRAVAITDLPNPTPPATIQYLHGVYDSAGDSTGKKLMGPVTYNSTDFQVVSVNDFYHRQLNQAELSELSPPVAYNPYIELAASHPITTNCMNCHHRAAWPPLASQGKPDVGRTSTYLQETPPNPNVLEVFPENAPIFNGLLTLDAMWAVSDRAGYPRRSTKR